MSTLISNSAQRYAPVASVCVLVIGIFAFFSAISYIATLSFTVAELSWPVILLFCLIVPSASYNGVSASYKYLARSMVIVVFVYIALQFPLYPVIHAGIYVSVNANIFAWCLALLITVLAWRTPKWLLAAGFYLPWVKALAEHASGFHYDRILDITPMFQILMFSGVVAITLGLQAQLWHRIGQTSKGKFSWFFLETFHQAPTNPQHDSPTPSSTQTGMVLASAVLVYIVISFHLAGYLFSGIAKATLDGGFWYWPLINNLQNIYLAGVINQQMIWLDLPYATGFFTALMDWIGRPMSLLVFFGQLAAFVAFKSKRVLISLLLFYDVMHIGIFVSQGANFFTWALVNFAVIAAAKGLPSRFFGLKPILASVVLMLFVQFAYGKFYRVPNLGWYDTKAVNNGYFEANSYNGDAVKVPIAFFTFYSYPISHMSYGHPEGQYVPTDTNGGTKYAAINEKANTCAFTESEMVSTKRHYWSDDMVTDFIQQYHRLAEKWFGDKAPLWLNLYWHHFWSPLSIHNEFKQVSLSSIESYTLVIESTCLNVVNSEPMGDIINTTRWSIPISRQ